ncbi:MAG: hypothetical protein HND51_21675 [Chloroflexi bacterium]|nr:hypothetical protein [Chloroflexota bacterium]
MSERVNREIGELHQFFEDWFLGKLPQTKEAFARFSSHMAEDFHIIPPSGAIISREELINNLWNAHNNTDAEFKIWVENIQVYVRPSFIYATYEEWQRRDGETTVRLSTAIFQEIEGAANQLQWLHVHETWMKP